MRSKTTWMVLLAGVLAMALAAGAQQAPPKPSAEQEKAKPAKKAPKKVWTDEDVKGLRKPSDEYAEQKSAAEQAAKSAEAKAPEAKPGEAEAAETPVDPKTGKPYEDPDSPEALERNLKQWEESLKRTEELAANARREMSQVTDPDRWESAKLEAETYEQNIEEIKKRIEETRVRLAEAQKQKKAPSKPSKPAPPRPRP